MDVIKYKVLELLKESKNPLVRDIAMLAIKNNRGFAETAMEYNQVMVKNKYKEGRVDGM